MECSRMERKLTEWNRMEWKNWKIGMEHFNRTGWNKIERNAAEWNENGMVRIPYGTEYTAWNS